MLGFARFLSSAERGKGDNVPFAHGVSLRRPSRGSEMNTVRFPAVPVAQVGELPVFVGRSETSHDHRGNFPQQRNDAVRRRRGEHRFGSEQFLGQTALPGQVWRRSGTQR